MVSFQSDIVWREYLSEGQDDIVGMLSLVYFRKIF